jgi:hypothetical protein
MFRTNRAARSLIGAGLLCVVLTASSAWAQPPAVVTTYYPPNPVVTYVPEPAGLFGLRTVYRPIVSYAPSVTSVAPAAPARVTTHYAPPPATAPVTTYYTPPSAPASVTTHYAPPAPASVTTYYPPASAPAAVTTYYPPPPPATTVLPAPVTTYHPVIVP